MTDDAQSEYLTHEVIVSRNTAHFYQDKEVPEEALLRALHAAIRAPNHKLTNPWRFVRMGPESREQITELGVALKCGDEASESRRERVRAKLSGPPVLLVVSQVLDEDAFRRKEDYASVACAIQNLSLSLWAEGVGSKWSTGGVTRHEQVYELAGIDSEHEEIVGFVWVGYPLHTATAPRKALDEVYREVP